MKIKHIFLLYFSIPLSSVLRAQCFLLPSYQYQNKPFPPNTAQPSWKNKKALSMVRIKASDVWAGKIKQSRVPPQPQVIETPQVIQKSEVIEPEAIEPEIVGDDDERDALIEEEALKIMELEEKAREKADREERYEQMRQMPMERECLRYSWEQTGDLMKVKFPLPRYYEPQDIHLEFKEDDIICLTTYSGREEFGTIAARMCGDVDEDKTKIRIVPCSRKPMNKGDAVSYELQLDIWKHSASEATYELWSDFLRGEKECPQGTMRFQARTRQYSWNQFPEHFEVTIPVPAETRKKNVRFEISPTGKSWEVSIHGMLDVYINEEVFCPIKGDFFGTVDARESTWLLEGEDEGREMTITFRKKRSIPDEVEWW
eukprot:CAMPEP_0113939790 /NCGR_PEP_ID=MMETSP1339-20121228/6042_1 /TAXON_ID=94617 /ORGANISM="Fibrocapsa japonica" /LENGTH=371 /DNA_ID=CAMNT_0000943403 /DNA_START=47 /DNA_END=1159 /DNA_ORIENTATION=- /assembly_acc=CAM_ASM_000762